MLLPMADERHSFIPGTVPPGTRGQARPGTSSAGGGGGVQRAPGTKTRRGSTNWDSMFGKWGTTNHRGVVAFSGRLDFFYMHLNDKDRGGREDCIYAKCNGVLNLYLLDPVCNLL